MLEENTYGICKGRSSQKVKPPVHFALAYVVVFLYRTATEVGATKIALGHHRDDILETLFLNMFYGGKLKGHAT